MVYKNLDKFINNKKIKIRTKDPEKEKTLEEFKSKDKSKITTEELAEVVLTLIE